MAIMKRLLLLASLIVVAACAGCYSLNVSEIDDSFSGISKAVDRSDVVCVLIVHGMGGYSKTDPQHIIDATISKLNLSSQGDETRRTIRHPDNKQLLGYLLRQDFKQMHSSTQVRIYTLHWSDATRSVKKQYVGYDNSEINNPHRLSLNHKFKRDLVNSNLSDVVLYLGEYGKTMLIPFMKAIEFIDGDVPQDDEYELILISFSLGSIMLLDAVEALFESDFCKYKRFCTSVSTFFMLANQVPLLLMGNYGIQDDDIDETQPKYNFARSLKRFIDVRQDVPAREDPHETLREFTIVAISDPNDLLSYRIPKWLRDEFKPDDPFVNVTTSVSRAALIIPFVGVVADPAAAHQNYGQDEYVLDLLVNGHKKK